MTRTISSQGMVAFGAAALLIALFGVAGGRTSAGQSSRSGIKIDGDDIGGTVTSAKGPEAGVWVIAETSDLPTHYIKAVVTDDRGRYEGQGQLAAQSHCRDKILASKIDVYASI